MLTQGIQLLGDDTQKVISEIVILSSSLAQLFSSYMTYYDLHTCHENVKTMISPKFFNRAH